MTAAGSIPRVSLRFDGRTYRARGVDLRDTDATVADALAALDAPTPEDPLATATAEPPALTRALATVARESGAVTPLAAEVETLRADIETLDARLAETVTEEPDPAAALAAARERAAAAGADVDRLRERVATLRGRLDEGGKDTAETFAAATRELTTAETERVAAAQRLASATERARAHRDARERRLRLADALANRRRRARARLAATVAPAFERAYETISEAFPAEGRDAMDKADSTRAANTTDATRTGSTANLASFAGDPVTAHLAAVRVAGLAGRTAPTVVALDRLRERTAPAVARRLATPIITTTPASLPGI